MNKTKMKESGIQEGRRMMGLYKFTLLSSISTILTFLLISLVSIPLAHAQETALMSAPIVVAEDNGGAIDILDRFSVTIGRCPSSAFDKGDALAVGDINGDGQDDIVVAEDNGGRIDIYNQTCGKIQLDGKTAEPFCTVFDKGDALAVGDIDGDGIAEILIAEDNGGRIDIYDHDQIFAARDPQCKRKDGKITVNTTFDKGDALAVGDVNGDGKDDIVVAEDNGGAINIYDQLGNIIGGRPSSAFDRGDALAVGDVNGDGKDDIVVAEDNGGAINIYDQFGNEIQLDGKTAERFCTVFDEGDALAVGDVDGDGKAEILVAEDNGGTIDIYDQEQIFAEFDPQCTKRRGKLVHTTFDRGDRFAVGTPVPIRVPSELGKNWDLVPNLVPGMPSVLDDNGLFLNPRWRWQRVGFEIPRFNVSRYKQESIQPITQDKPGFWSDLVPDVGGLNPKWRICRDPNGPPEIIGHLNWFDTTVEGSVFWDEFSSSDKDYNVRILTSEIPGGQKVDGQALLTGVTLDNGELRKCEKGEKCPMSESRGKLKAIKAEFDSRETINFKAFDEIKWWSDFHKAVDASNAQAGAMIDGHPGIITGLMGLDTVHGAASEIHPVHMFAVQIDERRNIADDAWAIFVRNWGNEGYCSDNQQILQLETFRLRLPRPEGLPPTARATIHPSTKLLGQKLRDRVDRVSPDVFSQAGTDAIVVFHLPPPAVRSGIIAGELHLSWGNVRAGIVQAPVIESGPISQTSEVARSSRKEEGLASDDEEEGAEGTLSEIIDNMTDEQRASYHALLNTMIPPPDQGIIQALEPILHDAPPPEEPMSMPTVSSVPSVRQMLLRDTVFQLTCLTAPDLVKSAGGDCSAFSTKKADLSITKAASPNPVTVGEKLTYTFTIKNRGPDDATGVIFGDKLPDGITFDSASEGCSEEDGTVTCKLGSLTNGRSTTVQIVVIPTKIEEITNTAIVKSNEIDLNLLDNAVNQLGDLDRDGDIDIDDVKILLADRGKGVEDSMCGATCDLDEDGRITALDARKLQLLCTRPQCATQ